MVYGFQPNTPLDINLLLLPHRTSKFALNFSSYMRDINEECKWCLAIHTDANAISENARYKDRQYNVGDIVLISLRLKQFPPQSFTKFHAPRVGCYKVSKRLGTNAYIIDLPPDLVLAQFLI